MIISRTTALRMSARESGQKCSLLMNDDYLRSALLLVKHAGLCVRANKVKISMFSQRQIWIKYFPPYICFIKFDILAYGTRSDMQSLSAMFACFIKQFLHWLFVCVQLREKAFQRQSRHIQTCIFVQFSTPHPVRLLLTPFRKTFPSRGRARDNYWVSKWPCFHCEKRPPSPTNCHWPLRLLMAIAH